MGRSDYGPFHDGGQGGGHGHDVGGRRPAIAGRRRDHHAHGQSVDVAYPDRGRGGRSTCQASVVEVSEQAKPWVERTAQSSGLRADFIAVLMRRESGFDPEAYANDSNGGTWGLLQINRSVWRASRRRGPDPAPRHHRSKRPRPIRRHISQEPARRRQTDQGKPPRRAIRPTIRPGGLGHRAQRRQRQPNEISRHPKRYQGISGRGTPSHQRRRLMLDHGRSHHRHPQPAPGRRWHQH